MLSLVVTVPTYTYCMIENQVRQVEQRVHLTHSVLAKNMQLRLCKQQCLHKLNVYTYCNTYMTYDKNVHTIAGKQYVREVTRWAGHTRVNWLEVEH